MTNARMKKIGKIAGLTLAGIAVLALVMLLSLGHIVKFTLTSIAPKVLDAPVKVDSVSVNVFSGVVDIRNLFIGNPVGYKNDRALTVKHIRVDIIPSTLTADKLVVEEFTLDGVDVYFEPAANLLSNNLSQLNENVQNFQKKLGLEEKAAPEKADTGKPEKETKLEVDDLNMNAIYVNVVASAPGLPATDAPLPVVPINLENLGKDNDGITPLDLTAAILNKLTLGVFASIGDAFPSLRSITNAGTAVLDKSAELLKGVGDLFKLPASTGSKGK